MSTYLITNAQVVNEDQIKAQDIFIKNGRIEQIGNDLSSLTADKIIDATGKILIPGMIDDQVHFREPGLTHKGDIGTESRAAVAGGIASFMEMPNVDPITDNLEALENKYKLAACKSLANYSFYLGATNKNSDVIKSLPPNVACGVKVFMGASTGDMLVDDINALESIFANCPILIATHCEDTPTVKANLAKAKERYGENIPINEHPNIRSRQACYKSSSLAISLAKKFNSHLHVLHLTTAEELEQFTSGAIANKNITGEACVHHLFFNAQDYDRLGNLIKCNPAIKTQNDQQALWQAINEDRIDIIATDHAPHTWSEKHLPNYQAPAGLPLAQHALLILLELYHKEVFNLETIVRKTSHNVAIRYKLVDRGFIREGYWADLVLIDPNKSTMVDSSNILYKCGWSPFYQHEFPSSIDSTFINGELIFQQGKFLRNNLGKRLALKQDF